MIGHMNIEEQVDVDFARAKRRSLLGRLGNRLRRDVAGGELESFDAARREVGPRGATRVDRRMVEVSKVVGSVGRSQDFDRGFMPAPRWSGRPPGAERWKRMDRAYLREEDVPPVRLYQVGDRYFVEDGHHRVSVARYHGVEEIEAEVRVFGGRRPPVDSGARLASEAA